MGWCTAPGCPEAFTSWEDHVLHHEQQHPAAANLGSFCGVCLVVMDAAGMHRSSHTFKRRQREKCVWPGCSASLENKQALRDHQDQFHGRMQVEAVQPPCTSSGLPAPGAPREYLGWCSFTGCYSGFQSWQDFVQHVMEEHVASVCPLCASFHAEAHGEFDAVCFRCGARFVNGLGLRYHESLFHGVTMGPTLGPWVNHN